MPSAPAPPPPGLRERKRRETRRAIQLAAIESAEEHGITGATVEVISGRANISPRTFFNHFPTKESALLGEEWLPITPEAAEAFAAARGPVLVDLGRLMLTVVNAEGLDRELVRRRLRLSEQHSTLAGSRVRWIAHLETDLRGVIAQRVDEEYPEADPRLRSRLTSLLAATAVSTFRSAWSWWADHGADDSLLDDILLSFSLLAAPAEALGSGQAAARGAGADASPPPPPRAGLS